MTEPFDTETMAELLARQGRVREALAIYRRLTAAAPDAHTRERRQRRAAEIAGGARPAPERASATPPSTEPPLAPPALTVGRSDAEVTVSWTLPDGTTSPCLQIVLIRELGGGVEVERRTVPLDGLSGTLTFPAPGVLRALAAAGSAAGGDFVPLVHSGQT